jgi:DNA-binding transcriptional MerR regulator
LATVELPLAGRSSGSVLRVEATLRIGQLAARIGVSPKTIRYYEDVELVPPPARSDGGYRLYGAEDERRLSFVVTARRVGFALGEIKEMLALREQGHPPCRYVTDRIERRIEDIEEQQAQLRALKGELIQLRDRAKALPEPAVEDGVYCHLLQR